MDELDEVDRVLLDHLAGAQQAPAHSRSSLHGLTHQGPPSSPGRPLVAKSKQAAQGSFALGHTRLWVAANLLARNRRPSRNCPESRPRGFRGLGSALQRGYLLSSFWIHSPLGGAGRGQARAQQQQQQLRKALFLGWEEPDRPLPACHRLLARALALAFTHGHAHTHTHTGRHPLGGLHGLIFR